VNMTPTNNATPGAVYSTGWDLVADLGKMNSNPQGTNIWDIIVYDGSLYAFITGTGFTVFKLTEADGEWTAKQIVGEKEEAQYPAGLGIGGHVAASPFLFNGYVYVTTFANGPVFLAQAAAGNLDMAFNDLYVPATIYRFNADDEWEVVVGDFVGENIAKDKNGTVVPSAGGNMRAGFYPGDNEKNPSSNLYVWYMAEYNGRLYASTWDVGVFRSMLPAMLALTFAQTYGMENVTNILSKITDVRDNLSAVIQILSESDLATALDDISVLLDKATEDIKALDIDGMNTLYEMRGILEQLAYDIVDVMEEAVGEICAPISDLRDSICGLFEAIAATAPELKAALTDTLSALSTTAFFLTDRSDPAGFDLFYSDDGVNFYPYTVNGLGDPNNYGGRVILPTENYGLLIFTANPFTGCQIWRLGDPAEITADIPETVSMKLKEEVSFDVRSVGLMPDDISVTLSDGTAVSATIEMIEELDTSFRYYSSTVEIVEKGILGQKAYEETEYPVHAYLYKVTLTGLSEFEGALDITIGIDGYQFDGAIYLEITGPVTLDIEGSIGVEDMAGYLADGTDGYIYTLTFVLSEGFGVPIDVIITGDDSLTYDLQGPDADGKYTAVIAGIVDDIVIRVTATEIVVSVCECERCDVCGGCIEIVCCSEANCDCIPCFCPVIIIDDAGSLLSASEGELEYDDDAGEFTYTLVFYLVSGSTAPVVTVNGEPVTVVLTDDHGYKTVLTGINANEEVTIVISAAASEPCDPGHPGTGGIVNRLVIGATVAAVIVIVLISFLISRVRL